MVLLNCLIAIMADACTRVGLTPFTLIHQASMCNLLLLPYIWVMPLLSQAGLEKGLSSSVSCLGR